MSAIKTMKSAHQVPILTSVYVFNSWQRISVAIPLMGIAAFLPCLRSSRLLQAKFVALLAISSLLCTAYILVFLSKVDWQQTNPLQGKA